MFIAWQPLRDALQYAKPRVASQRPLPPSFLNLGPRTLIVPLRSLTVNGNTTTYYLHMFPELDVFKDLVSLSIRYSKANYAAIRSIFKTCSSLQHLRLDGNSHITESISPTVAHPLARMDFVVPQLKTLIIVKPDLSFAQILDLLGTQHSLQELELQKLCVVHKNQGNIHVTIRHSLEAGILAYLREHGSSLQCLHVTIVQTDGDVTDYGPSSKYFRDDLIQACPHVLEWGALLDTNGYCSMIQPLTSHPNMVTTLHLQSGASQAFPRWQRNTFDLDRYLCQAPLLLHLRVPKMVGLPESMFAFRDMDSTMHWIGNSATPARRQPVWLCRGLKTLSIGFLEPYWETDKIWNYYDGSKQARVVFGYLSRVCPDMKELEIHLHLNNLFLETGLCLLTRMKQLRKLEVRLGKGTWELAPRIEIDWMNVESVGRDAGVGAEWQARRENPDQLPWNILEPEEGAIIESRGGTKIQRSELEFDSEQARYQGQPVRDGLQVSDPWEYLGMFADVESVSRGLQIAAWEGRHCWPEMKTLTICNAWGKSNEAEVVIRKLRPDIESLEFQEPWY
ncbi:hypothetical protein BG000_007745 [Podila horticola]|nr:hypothetical protein BG000_007745 [Podila horticola]